MKSTTDTPVNAELLRLEVLHKYKARFGGKGGLNDSPFGEEVMRYHSEVSGLDVPAIHHDVRERIEQIIKGIHDGQVSQVVILTGNPGMGKTHLINAFRNRSRADEGGYTLVCNSNHWKAAEFEECLLDWILSALIFPSPDESNLLLERVQDIAFAALQQILDRPGEISRFQQKRMLGFVSRFWGRLTGAEHGRYINAIEHRDVSIFRKLHFSAFAADVCKRYLLDPNNVFHRYVIHVLLRYLFVEDREKVIHWLRGKSVGNYFLKRLGIRDDLDQKKYKIFEVVKILISIFTPEVSAKLQPIGSTAVRDRVFFFAFDQSEAREALFESAEDWTKFFGQLSELYNALPNVFILFTMTLSLRNRYFSGMEAQFRDRIRQDQHFILNEIKPHEILALYRQRMERWLGDDRESVKAQLDELHNPFLPFDQVKVIELAGNLTLRDMLRSFDLHFREALKEQVSDVKLDYQVYLNELNQAASQTTPNDFTQDHLKTVEKLLKRAGFPLAQAAEISFHSSEWQEKDDMTIPALRIQFCHQREPQISIRIFLVRLPFVYKSKKEETLGLLSNLIRARNHLWIVRPNGVSPSWQENRPEQVFLHDLDSSEEAALQSAHLVYQQKDRYSEDAWQSAEPYLIERVMETHFGKLLKHAKTALDRLALGNEPADSTEIKTINPAGVE